MALCYCSCTRRINDVIDTMLSQGEILDGFLLNHMANAVFFEASNQMNGKLAHVLSERGLHLTKRYAAGEGEVPLSVQAIILDALKTETELEVNLTSNYMLEPEHSMLYYFGADAGITGHSTRHDCGACNSEDCPFRDVEGDVAEGLIKNAKPQTSWSALRAFDRLYRGFSSHRVIPFFRGAVNAWTWPAGGGTIPFGGEALKQKALAPIGIATCTTLGGFYTATPQGITGVTWPVRIPCATRPLTMKSRRCTRP